MKFLIYDFSLKKYYRRFNGNNWGWTCFKQEAYRFDSVEDAQALIKYYQTFSSNEFKILIIKPASIRVKGREYQYMRGA